MDEDIGLNPTARKGQEFDSLFLRKQRKGYKMFYTFRQNNSFGTFVVDKDVSYYVIVEADSYDEANEKAEEIGVYFDGVRNGHDCPCCGNRWNRCDTYDATDEPVIYGEPYTDYESREVRIYRKDIQ
jgi:hypothetical protein